MRGIIYYSRVWGDKETKTKEIDLSQVTREGAEPACRVVVPGYHWWGAIFMATAESRDSIFGYDG